MFDSVTYSREYYLKNKEKIQARNRENYYKNREKYLANMKAYREANPDKASFSDSRYADNYYRKNYGISFDDYNRMNDAQNGKCKICGNEDTKRLAVDHCHTTGKVRGLLCFKCNRAIGCFSDSIGLLEKAIEYLKGE